MDPLVSVAELQNLIMRSDVRIVDVRWRLDEPDGRERYLAGHIPSAVYGDLEQELSRPSEPAEGRHPLPDPVVLQAAARSWGVDDDSLVVVYDDAGSIPAARAWWLLTRSGFDRVRVLDGGWAAWLAAGQEVETGSNPHRPGSVTSIGAVHGGIGIDQAARWPDSGVLIDARAPERYRGEIEPIDPVAGHIPGAVNLPASALTDQTGRLRPPGELRAAFAAVGADADRPVAAYCGSGVTAAFTALAGAVAGLEIQVYPGSWSQWSNTPGRPVAPGESEPGLRE